MSHRPYPNADRAVRQLERHATEAGPYREPRQMTPMERMVVDYARHAVRAAAPAVASLAAAFQQRPAGSEEKTG